MQERDHTTESKLAGLRREIAVGIATASPRQKGSGVPPGRAAPLRERSQAGGAGRSFRPEDGGLTFE